MTEFEVINRVVDVDGTIKMIRGVCFVDAALYLLHYIYGIAGIQLSLNPPMTSYVIKYYT